MFDWLQAVSYPNRSQGFSQSRNEVLTVSRCNITHAVHK